MAHFQLTSYGIEPNTKARGPNPLNRYYIEWRSDLSLWVIIESNRHGVRVVATCDTPESAAVELSVLEAIEGAIRIAQNGATNAADCDPNFTTNH